MILKKLTQTFILTSIFFVFFSFVSASGIAAVNDKFFSGFGFLLLLGTVLVELYLITG